jgi:cysteine desulfurase family protein (TIGR01976 family)
MGTPSTVASVETIRGHFPALERIHNGHPVAYFDGPGGTQVPREVVEDMVDYLLRHNANTHWSYPTSAETDDIIQASRESLADFLNASPDEIVFGQNMTSLTFHLARALGRSFAPGDELIVTELDHHANVDTWRSLEKDRGVTIRVLPVDVESGTLDLDGLDVLFNQRTKLLAIGAASNAIGTVTDVAAACRKAKDAGVLSFVDAVHYAAHELVDVKAIGCDFLACSAYKFYGPHIGVLYGRRELLERTDFPKLRPSPDNAPDRAETGTQSHESIAGAAAAVNYLASLADDGTRRERLQKTYAAFGERKKELMRFAFEELGKTDGVRLFGPGPESPRTPTLAIAVKDIPAQTVTERLVERGIFTSHGDFYAQTIVDRLGYGDTGLVRAGCACYTSFEEMERLVDGIRGIATEKQ